MLGPYRNLTTLTASLLSLHPACQVLNHAGSFVFPIKAANFLLGYSPEKFDNFVKYAIYLSRGGRVGGSGGSITFSHAFTEHAVMRRAYEKRYGDSLVKQNIQCVVWKESMRVSNVIKDNDVELLELCAHNEKLRFLMPIRNPLDCAISNSRKPTARHLGRDDEETSVEGLLDSIVGEISWFLGFHDRMPDRFFMFYEDELGGDVLSRLAGFLEIEVDEDWLGDAVGCIQLREPYQYSSRLLDHYERSLHRHLERHPAALERLLQHSAAARA